MDDTDIARFRQIALHGWFEWRGVKFIKENRTQARSVEKPGSVLHFRPEDVVLKVAIRPEAAKAVCTSSAGYR